MRLDRIRNYYPGGVYHIFNRGNNKQIIFREKEDYVFYIIKLRKCLKKYNATLFSYCLMPNHVHLEIRQNSLIPLSNLMSGLHTSYTNYFNKKYNNIGHLFQSRYKAKEIKSKVQFLELIFYIHINPVVANLVHFPESWMWSSAQDYAGNRNGTLCDKIAINLLGGVNIYNDIIKNKIKTAQWKYINDILLE